MRKAGKRANRKWMKIVSVMLALMLAAGTYTPVTVRAEETGSAVSETGGTAAENGGTASQTGSEAEDVGNSAPASGTDNADEAVQAVPEAGGAGTEDDGTGAGKENAGQPDSEIGKDGVEADADTAAEPAEDEDKNAGGEADCNFAEGNNSEIPDSADDMEAAEEITFPEENMLAAGTELPVSGQNSINVTWSIDINGNLTVEGSGNWAQVKPNDYSASFFPPWHAYSDQIITASINLYNKINGNGADDPVTSLEAMFFNCKNLTSVNFNNTDTQYVTNMSEMFQNCKSLTTITWGDNFTTAAVTGKTGRKASEGMEGMFYGCESLTTLDVSRFDTSNVLCMENMFCACYKLTSLDLSKFDTSKVKNMEDMFRCCYALESLTLGTTSHKFVIGAGTIVPHMFYQCKKLTDLDLTQIDTSAATDLSYMFDEWTGAAVIDARVLNTENVTNMSSMFCGCENLTSLTLGGNFVTNSVTNMGGMFSGCKKLTDLNISSFNTGNVTDMNNLFSNCEALETLTWGDTFTTGNVENMTGMFEGCKSLTALDVSKFDTANVTGMSYMFKDCSGLERLKLVPEAGSGQTTAFKTSNVEDMSYMFCNCSALTSLNLGDQFHTGNVTTTYSMFDDCRALTSLDLGANFNTAKVTGMTNMFKDCIALTSLNLGEHFDTSSVQSMDGMFNGCWKLEALDLGSLFDTSSATNMSEMFCNCWALETLDLGDKFDTGNVTDMEWMFGTCTGLKKLTLGSMFNTSNVTNMGSMFYRCDILTSLDLSSFDAAKVTKADYMLSGNHEMTLIKCPVNLTQDVTLPMRNYGNEGIYWMDDRGKEYTTLPKGLTQSITLVRSDREEEEEVQPGEEEKTGSETRTKNSAFRVTYENQLNETVSRYFRTYIGVANYVNGIENDIDPPSGQTGTYDYTITYLKESPGYDLYFQDETNIDPAETDYRFVYRAISKAKSITYDFEKKNGNAVCFACTMNTKIPLIIKFDNVFFKQENLSDPTNVLHKLGKVTYNPNKTGFSYIVDTSFGSNMEMDELTICGDRELWIDAEPTIKIGKLHMGSGRIIVTSIEQTEPGSEGEKAVIDKDRLGTRTIGEITTETGLQYIAVGMPENLKDGESVDCFTTKTNPEDINLKLRDAHENEYAKITESTVDGEKYYTMTVHIGKETGGKENYQYKVIYDESAPDPISTWAEVLADIDQNAVGKAVTIKPVKNGYLWSTNADWDWKEALEGLPVGISSLVFDFTAGGEVSIRNTGGGKVDYPVTLKGSFDFLYDENAGGSRAFDSLTVEGYHTSLRLHCNLAVDTLIVKNDIPVYLYASQRDDAPADDVYGRLTAGELNCSQTPAGKLKFNLAGFGYKAGDSILTTGNPLTAELYEYSQNESDESQYDVTIDDSNGKYSLKLETCYLVVFEDPNHYVVTPPSQRIKSGGKAARVDDPVLDGWTFEGWYKDESFTELWDFDNDTVDKNIRLYAKMVKDGTSDPNTPDEPDTPEKPDKPDTPEGPGAETVTPPDTEDTYYHYEEKEQKDISSAAIAAIKDKVYDGKPYLPAVKVTVKNENGKDTALTEGADYRVVYEKNVNAGTGKVIIKGNGLYKGTKEASFKITEKPMTKLKAVAGSMMKGASGQPVINIYDGSTLLTPGKDYKLELPSGMTASTGKKKVTAEALSGSNYKGSLKVTVSVIEPKKNAAMLTPENTVVTLGYETTAYTGSACKPEVAVKYNGTALALKKDYSVKYTNNTNAGIAYVTVTGKSAYCGSLVKTFEITQPKTDFALKKAMKAATYNGKLQKPKPAVQAVVNGKTKSLKLGRDYVLLYQNNLHAGKDTDVSHPTVIVRGIGNYDGISKSIAFTINPQKISKASVKGTKDALVLTYAKRTLVPGTDYDKNIVYTDGAKGKVNAVITGLGDFAGTTVTKKNIKVVK